MLIYFIDEDQKVLRRVKRIKDGECQATLTKIVEENLLDMLSYVAAEYVTSSLVNVATPTDIFVANTYRTAKHDCVVYFRVI